MPYARSMNDKLPLVCILGQTGTGKTDLALELAKRWPVEVINFDSRQVYQELPIVTAQPTLEERSVCPHHLYGFLRADQKINAGDFVRLAKEKIAQVVAKNKLPVLVGGTGLYLRALISGLAAIPRVEPKIKQKVADLFQSKGLQGLYQFLQQVDPGYAIKIHPNDRQRITRALEVFFQTEKPFSFWHKRTPKASPYNYLKLGLKMDLNLLEPHLEKRIDKMLELGAVQEVKGLWSRYQDSSLPGFSSIGVKEILAYLKQELSWDEMKSLWLKSTRAYAKRQLVWFKKEKDVHWQKPQSRNKLIIIMDNWLKDLRVKS